MNPILVIDDEEMYREMMSKTLRHSGYTVLEAENGEKGIEIVQNQPVELIISDVMMDNLDGFGFIERVRMDPATSTIPFVFVTGLADKKAMRKGMTLGADDFLVKPFSGDDLVSAIASQLAKHKETVDESERKLAQLRSSISLALPHEIRTPLASILGFGELLSDDSNLPSSQEAAEYGKRIVKAGRKLQRLLENFVTYAQLEVIASDPRKMEVIKMAHLSESAEMIRYWCRKKAELSGRPADLGLDLSDSPVAISEVHLNKICDEVLDNAFKFSAAGSKVSVTSAVEKDEFVLTITDQGRGMKPEQIALLGEYLQFDRKFHEQQGTGLGLTIAKRLTELHGGRMGFESTSEQGLTVRVRVPVHTRTIITKADQC